MLRWDCGGNDFGGKGGKKMVKHTHQCGDGNEDDNLDRALED